MTHTPIPEIHDPSSASQDTSDIDQTRRKLASAGLGGSAVLLTLASRPVLGATCLTPSAAGSGNHSQHNPIACMPQNLQSWIDNVPRKTNGQIDNAAFWTGTSYTPGTLFHPLFTKSPLFEYMNGSGLNGVSYTLYDVLSKGNTLSQSVDTNDIGKYFVMGLLNASAGNYGGVIQPEGPDPSVRGIEDEYAVNGFFVPTAGKKWYFNTIIAYLQDPGSVF